MCGVSWHCRYAALHQEKKKKFISVCGVSWKTGWPLCDKAFTFGCSQEAAGDGRHSNQSVPGHLHQTLSSELPIHLWTEIPCLFSSLFPLQSFGAKLNLMPMGQDGKLGQNSLFPHH